MLLVLIFFAFAAFSSSPMSDHDSLFPIPATKAFRSKALRLANFIFSFDRASKGEANRKRFSRGILNVKSFNVIAGGSSSVTALDGSTEEEQFTEKDEKDSDVKIHKIDSPSEPEEQQLPKFLIRRFGG